MIIILLYTRARTSVVLYNYDIYHFTNNDLIIIITYFLRNTQSKYYNIIIILLFNYYFSKLIIDYDRYKNGWRNNSVRYNQTRKKYLDNYCNQIRYQARLNHS